MLGNPQRDVGDWLPLIYKPDTIAMYSVPTATCQQQPLLTMCARAYTHAGQKCRNTEQKKMCYYSGSNSMIDRERERERERDGEGEGEREKGGCQE